MNKSKQVFPDLPVGLELTLVEEPIFLNNMEVVFDEKAGLYPVNLIKKVSGSKHERKSRKDRL